MYFYYLIGQPHLRSEDRFRHITSDRIRVTAAHPFKHKHSSEQGRTLEERYSAKHLLFLKQLSTDYTKTFMVANNNDLVSEERGPSARAWTEQHRDSTCLRVLHPPGVPQQVRLTLALMQLQMSHLPLSRKCTQRQKIKTIKTQSDTYR